MESRGQQGSHSDSCQNHTWVPGDDGLVPNSAIEMSTVNVHMATYNKKKILSSTCYRELGKWMCCGQALLSCLDCELFFHRSLGFPYEALRSPAARGSHLPDADFP